MSHRSFPQRESVLIVALLLVALNLRPALASLGPVLEAVRSSLQLSHGMAGLLSSLSIVCMGLFAPLAMPLCLRWGLKQTVLVMLLLIGGATLLRLQASLLCLWSSAILTGAGIAILGPLLSTFIKQVFPARSARMSAWVTTAICLGAAIAAGSTAPLGERFGWPAALGSWAMLAFAGAWLWWRAAPNLAGAPVSHSLTLPWRQVRAWQLLFAFGLQSMVFYCVLTWLAPAYVSFGLSASEAGHLLGWFALVQILGTLLVSSLPAQQRDRRLALLGSASCALLGLLAIWLAPLLLPYVWLCLLGIGIASLFALTMILPLDFADSPQAAGNWTAMMLFGGYLISACGPYTFGLLLDLTGSYRAVFAALCGVSASVVLLCTLLAPPRR